MKRLGISLLLILLSFLSVFANEIEGYGITIGGAGGIDYIVTSLADSGPGTLRDACSESNRNIIFAVEGTITLNSRITIREHHLTIDGSTSPGGCINLIGPSSYGLMAVRTSHDIIIRGIRFDGSLHDCLQIWGEGVPGNVYNIAIDGCSFRSGGDGGLDITDGVRNITVQWCFIGWTLKNSLITGEPATTENITLHHNLYYGTERNPQISNVWNFDFVNNVVYDWDTYGSRVRRNSYGNIVNNYYERADANYRAIWLYDINLNDVYCQENAVNSSIPEQYSCRGTRDFAFPTPYPVTTTSAITALRDVLENVGCFPRDFYETEILLNLEATSVENNSSWGSIKGVYR